MKTATCVGCGEKKKIKAKDRCSPCYNRDLRGRRKAAKAARAAPASTPEGCAQEQVDPATYTLSRAQAEELFKVLGLDMAQDGALDMLLRARALAHDVQAKVQVQLLSPHPPTVADRVIAGALLLHLDDLVHVPAQSLERWRMRLEAVLDGRGGDL